MNVNQASRALSRANAGPGLIQPGICFDVSHGEHCDEAIAELFYACNIPAAVADHPKFIKVVKALRAAPSSYKPPDRQKLHGALLDAEILAEVYLAMTGGQATLSLSAEATGMAGEVGGANEMSIRRLSRDRPPLPVVQASAEELERHEARLDELDQSSGGALWRQGVTQSH